MKYISLKYENYRCFLSVDSMSNTRCLTKKKLGKVLILACIFSLVRHLVHQSLKPYT